MIGAGAPDVEVVAEVSDGLAAERAARALRAAIAAQDGACSPEAATGPSIADAPAARP